MMVTARPADARNSVLREQFNMKSLPAGVLLIVGLLAPVLVSGRFALGAITLALVYCVLVLGFNLTVGYCGQVSLGHIGFWGIGAYSSAIMTVTVGAPIWFGALVGIVAAAVAAFALTAITLRLKTHYLALATIGFAEIIRLTLVNWTSLTHGSRGLGNIPSMPNFTGNQQISNYYVLLLIVVLCTVLTWRFATTRIGRAAIAVKHNEDAAECTGVSARTVKLTVGVGAAIFAALAGTMYVHTMNFVSPDVFGFGQLIAVLAMLMIGGQGTVLGPVVGAVALSLLPEYLREFEEYWDLIYGVMVLILILFLPRGVVGQVKRALLLRRSLGKLEAASVRAGGQPTGGGGVASTADPQADAGRGFALELEDVSVRFGGVDALSDFRMVATVGEIRAVIGPNGAGKTTMINVCSGLVAPNSGAVRLAGRDITRSRPFVRCNLGLGRTFQAAQVFPDLTVFENILIGAENGRDGKILGSFLPSRSARRRDAEARRQVHDTLRLMELSARAGEPAEMLPYGLQREVDIARVISMGARIVVLDEPVAGLNDREAERLSGVIVRLKESGVGCVIVEHNMEFLMKLADKVTVLTFGTVIADGTSDEIQRNPEVIDAYLGTV